MAVQLLRSNVRRRLKVLRHGTHNIFIPALSTRTLEVAPCPAVLVCQGCDNTFPCFWREVDVQAVQNIDKLVKVYSFRQIGRLASLGYLSLEAHLDVVTCVIFKCPLIVTAELGFQLFRSRQSFVAAVELKVGQRRAYIFVQHNRITLAIYCYKFDLLRATATERHVGTKDRSLSVVVSVFRLEVKQEEVADRLLHHERLVVCLDFLA